MQGNLSSLTRTRFLKTSKYPIRLLLHLRYIHRETLFINDTRKLKNHNMSTVYVLNNYIYCDYIL